MQAFFSSPEMVASVLNTLLDNNMVAGPARTFFSDLLGRQTVVCGKQEREHRKRLEEAGLSPEKFFSLDKTLPPSYSPLPENMGYHHKETNDAEEEKPVVNCDAEAVDNVDNSALIHTEPVENSDEEEELGEIEIFANSLAVEGLREGFAEPTLLHRQRLREAVQESGVEMVRHAIRIVAGFDECASRWLAVVNMCHRWGLEGCTTPEQADRLHRARKARRVEARYDSRKALYTADRLRTYLTEMPKMTLTAAMKHLNAWPEDWFCESLSWLRRREIAQECCIL